MTRVEKLSSLAGVAMPLAGFCTAVILLWHRGVFLHDLIILAVLYLVAGLAMTVGVHRLLTHRAFATYKWVEYTFAVLATLALQGPVIHWVADHRKHHSAADAEGDPHSPHVGPGKGVLRGLVHAHVGWLFQTVGKADPEVYARDLVQDDGMRRISQAFGLLSLFTLLIPFGLGLALTGTVEGGLVSMVWGGFVRVFLFHHAAFSVNSLGHFLGARRFATEDHSTNVAWLALPSLGEGWHNNHHAFPRSAFHGLRWWELDIAGAFIRLLRRLGLAWNVVEISPQRQHEVAAADRPVRSLSAR